MDWNLGTFLKVLAGLVTAFWGGLEPLTQLLIGLMVIDILTGFLAGYVTRSLSSEISFRGMAKKAIILLLAVGLPKLMAPTIDLPIGQAIAGFYAANELLSVIENTARAGLPVPQVLKDALTKLSTEKVPDKT